MKRFIDQHLLDWKKDHGKPLILRGARQVGKTFAVRQLGKTFDNFVEINFEEQRDLKNIFERDLDPNRIILELSQRLNAQIIPGKTLLFFDEIQAAPLALTSLRYFYEKLPTLHVLAAGSLIDFAIQEVGIPVGRVRSLYVYPLSFIEFMIARGYSLLSDGIRNHSIDQPFSKLLHDTALRLVSEYLAIGGMPEAVKTWCDFQDPFKSADVHQSLIDAYRQDFVKYAKTSELKYVQALFNQMPKQIGKKFKYSGIEGDYRKRELSPCLDLLKTACIVHKVLQTSGTGVPFGALAGLDHFKIIYLDVAIAQALMGIRLGDWIVYSLDHFVNKGEIVEAFIGQELFAYSSPFMKTDLYYWHRGTRASQAEVDYLIQQGDKVIPIEVKSGKGTTLKSMHMFLQTHSNSPYGIRFSAHNYSIHEKIHSYPLYAVAQAVNFEGKL